jgi:hypothetical protein
MDTRLDLEKLEKLAEAATPGAWESDCEFMLIFVGNAMVAEMRGYGAGLPQADNARFIAAFNPEAAKALIAELREAREALRQLQERFDYLLLTGHNLSAKEQAALGEGVRKDG